MLVHVLRIAGKAGFALAARTSMEGPTMVDVSTKAAVVQRPPVLLDRGATMAVAVDAVAEVAAAGASLVVFLETFIPGYPAWIWSLRPDD